MARGKWKRSPEERERLRQMLRASRSKALSPENQAKRRLAQIKWEEDIAEEMRGEGWAIFSPTIVCDRIGIKDGKVYFIEFKKEGQELREGQQKISDLMRGNYLIVFR